MFLRRANTFVLQGEKRPRIRKIKLLGRPGSTLLCLSIANTGGGDVVLTDGEKAVCLSYGYKYGVADIFFPVVGKEAFHCKEIDLKTVSDIIKNRNSKDAPKVYVWY